MRGILAATGLCAAYVIWHVYRETAIDEPVQRRHNKGHRDVLAGLGRRDAVDEIVDVLRRRDILLRCPLSGPLELSLSDGTCYHTHVREGLRRFLTFRLAVLHHYTGGTAVCGDVFVAIFHWLLRLTPAINYKGRPLDWLREWPDVMSTQRCTTARRTFNAILAGRPSEFTVTTL